MAPEPPSPLLATPPRLTTLPVEVLFAILSNLPDLADLLSVAASCRDLCHLWKCQKFPLLEAVARRQIPAYQDVLLAARVTALVKGHRRDTVEDFAGSVDNSETVPQQIKSLLLESPPALSSESELSNVLRLSHLARCVEVRCRARFDSLGIPREEWLVGSKSHFWQSPRERFHRAVYRSLVVGAALSVPYTEPFDRLDAPQNGQGEAGLSLKAVFSRSAKYDDPSEEQRNYLSQFAAYHPSLDPVDYAESFEPFAGTLICYMLSQMQKAARSRQDYASLDQESEAEQLSRQERVDFGGTWDPPGAGNNENQNRRRIFEITRSEIVRGLQLELPAEGDILVYEIMRIVFAFEAVLECIDIGLDALSQTMRPWEIVPEPLPLDGTVGVLSRPVSVFLLGVFEAEDIILPANPMDVLRFNFAYAMKSSLSICRSLEHLFIFEPQMLYAFEDEYSLPPPPLQFFSYVLRTYFGLQFGRHAFALWPEDLTTSYDDFLRDLLPFGAVIDSERLDEWNPGWCVHS